MSDIKINSIKNDILSRLVKAVKESVNESKVLLVNTEKNENYYSLHRNIIHTYVPLSSLLVIRLAVALTIVICKNKSRHKQVRVRASEILKPWLTLNYPQPRNNP